MFRLTYVKEVKSARDAYDIYNSKVTEIKEITDGGERVLSIEELKNLMLEDVDIANGDKEPVKVDVVDMEGTDEEN